MSENVRATVGDRAQRILTAAWVGAGLYRLAYLALQPLTDPTFAKPIYDGAYYAEWARALVGTGEPPAGAFYLAPLYPYTLSVFFAVFGERWWAPFLFQQLLAVGVAAAIALRGGRYWGAGAPLAATLLLLHQPLVYFASRPLAESVAIPLLLLSVLVAQDTRRTAPFLAGALAGLATLARPNLILVPLLWAVGEGLGRRPARALSLIAGAALLVLPVTVRNAVVSGHPVFVTSNAGITLYHGNGPGARGVYTPPAGFSGSPRTQRREATQLARLRSGSQLDDVEADRYWGRQALRARLDDPPHTLGLALRRAVLILDNHELALDYVPLLDTNPLRLSWRGGGGEWALVSFALLLALSGAAVARFGFGGSGGWRVWAAVAACAATPLLFYVASRYRLPTAALLAIPAGCGLGGLLGLDVGVAQRSRRTAALVGAVVLVLSGGLLCALPGSACADLATRLTGQGLSTRSLAWRDVGQLDRALEDGRRAVELVPRSAQARYNYGVVARAAGRTEIAERSFREALDLEPPGRAEAAADLASLLIDRGEASGAIPILRRALSDRPVNRLCWNNLVVALAATGDLTGARGAAAQALERGVSLDPALLELIHPEATHEAGS